jgi:hypothetical protein
VIRATVSAALRRGWECVGIRDGFNGILLPERYPDGGVFRLTQGAGARHFTPGRHHSGHDQQGRSAALSDEDAGRQHGRAWTAPASWWRTLPMNGIDALVTVGGDGSLSIAHELHRKGLRVVGVPKTIDNDLDKTFTTFGFDTAVSFRHRMPGPPAQHGREPPAHHGGRDDGALCRVDCARKPVMNNYEFKTCVTGFWARSRPADRLADAPAADLRLQQPAVCHAGSSAAPPTCATTRWTAT